MALVKFYKNIVSEAGDYVSFLLTDIDQLIVKYNRDIDRRKALFEFELLSDLYQHASNLMSIITVSFNRWDEIRFRTKYAGEEDPKNEIVINKKDFDVNYYFDYVAKVNRYFGMLIDADELKVFNKGEDVLCFTIVFNSKLRN